MSTYFQGFSLGKIMGAEKSLVKEAKVKRWGLAPAATMVGAKKILKVQADFGRIICVVRKKICFLAV